jgi:hypothetical protein
MQFSNHILITVKYSDNLIFFFGVSILKSVRNHFQFLCDYPNKKTEKSPGASTILVRIILAIIIITIEDQFLYRIIHRKIYKIQFSNMYYLIPEN